MHCFRFIPEPNNITYLPWKMTRVTKTNRAEKHMSSSLSTSRDLSSSEREIDIFVVSFFNTALECESKGKHFQKELSARTEFISRDIYQKYFHSCISTSFKYCIAFSLDQLLLFKPLKCYVPHTAVTLQRVHALNSAELDLLRVTNTFQYTYI